MNRRLFAQATIALASGLAGDAWAQGPAVSAAQLAAYPDKPVQMIIPYPPGQAIDVIGRILADGLGKNCSSVAASGCRPAPGPG